MIKVSDYIANRLKEHYKIDNVFLISGGGAMHLNDSFGKYINYHTAHHEQALAMMAEGYSRVYQKLSVVNVTTGPGGLNCLTGLFGEWTDSVPVLYISGQVKYSTTIASVPNLKLRQLGDQEVDIISVVKPLTKYAVSIVEANSVKYHLDKAIYEATHDRFGPVWIDVPMNIQSAMIDENNIECFIPPEDTIYNLEIDKVLEKLKSSKYPLIVLGHGVRLSNQIDNFLKLVDKLKIPVVSSFNAMDSITDDNPYFIGRIGTEGHRAGNFAIQNADLVLCLGTRNNIRQISYNYENFAKNAYKIVVDIDKAELNKPTIIPDLKIHADLSSFIPELLKKCSPLDRTYWLDFSKNIKAKYLPKNNLEHKNKDGKINPYNFIMTLTSLLPDNAIITTTNATPSIAIFQSGVIKSDKVRVIRNSGNASMGFGLPSSIGAFLADEKRPVICLDGDGSIMMNIQELQTIKHYNMPIKIFVINNNGYVSIKQTQDKFFDGRMTGVSKDSGVSMPEFTKIADAFGIKSCKIDSADSLDKKIKEVLYTDGAILCEVVVDFNYIFTPKLSARKLDDGSIVSPSLEDMFPFLDRDEYKKNIISEEIL